MEGKMEALKKFTFENDTSFRLVLNYKMDARNEIEDKEDLMNQQFFVFMYLSKLLPLKTGRTFAVVSACMTKTPPVELHVTISDGRCI
jgi:hypothetical protein